MCEVLLEKEKRFNRCGWFTCSGRPSVEGDPLQPEKVGRYVREYLTDQSMTWGGVMEHGGWDQRDCLRRVIGWIRIQRSEPWVVRINQNINQPDSSRHLTRRRREEGCNVCKAQTDGEMLRGRILQKSRWDNGMHAASSGFKLE
jgi:hypothetical protein